MHHFLLILANPIGILGVIILLIAYLLLSLGRWSSDSITYQVYNLLGAVFILYSLYFYWNLASALIEAAWVVISLIGICRVMKLKKNKS